jgi:ABC-2 type transport system permease protein
MKALNFAQRSLKEIIRDPLSIIFALLLPLFLLFIFQQFNIPSEVYSIENFTPGIIVFGFSFITLFTAVLVANDRNTSLITRLCASPMKISDYILGYIISVLPVVILQNVLFFITALLLGLKPNINILFTIIVALPVSLLFVLLGILIGCITTDKSSSGVSSVIVQLVAFTSGMYFPKEMLGGVFAGICEWLPFESCLTILKGIMNNNLESITSRNIIIFVVYTVLFWGIAVIVFQKKMVSDNK